MDPKLWEVFHKSKVFRTWYFKRLKTTLSNVYDIRTKSIVDITYYMKTIKPSIQTLIDFVLDLDGIMNIDVHSVEKNPIVVCIITHTNINVKRISRDLYTSVSVAVCEFAHEYDLKKGAK
jgi:hypothetical protein